MVVVVFFHKVQPKFNTGSPPHTTEKIITQHALFFLHTQYTYIACNTRL
jgi:hypothetical protein